MWIQANCSLVLKSNCTAANSHKYKLNMYMWVCVIFETATALVFAYILTVELRCWFEWEVGTSFYVSRLCLSRCTRALKHKINLLQLHLLLKHQCLLLSCSNVLPAGRKLEYFNACRFYANYKYYYFNYSIQLILISLYYHIQFHTI